MNRVHHCSICKICIIDFDHHCPWIKNCVGINNRSHFLMFLFHLFILTSLIGWLTYYIDLENYSEYVEYVDSIKFVHKHTFGLSFTILIFGSIHWILTITNTN